MFTDYAKLSVDTVAEYRSENCFRIAQKIPFGAEVICSMIPQNFLPDTVAEYRSEICFSTAQKFAFGKVAICSMI